MRILDITEQLWQLLCCLRGKAFVQRVDQQDDLGALTRLAHPLEGQCDCPFERRLRLESAQINVDSNRRPAGSNVAGVDLDVSHLDLR
jgi:hypothetical protein